MPGLSVPFLPAGGFRLFAAFLLALLLAGGPSMAVLSPDEMLDDPQMEERAREIALEVRCLVCQNQSIDDSDAPLARDLRLLIRERLVAGDSDDEVMAYLEARYGEFVRMRPVFAPHTVLLWGAPVLLLTVGLIAVATTLRRRRTRVEPATLTEAERRELDRLIDEKE